MAPEATSTLEDEVFTKLLLGKRIRHFRTTAGLTLDALGERVGVVGSQLSLIENGHREPRITLLHAIARELGIDPAELLRPEPPDRRSALEIELERVQSTQLYQQLQLPHVRTPRTLSDDALESLIGLHRELAKRSRAAAATPAEARRANTAIRMQMRKKGNYLGDIERIAEDLMADFSRSGVSAVTHREVAVLARKLGFTLIFVDDLPQNTRSIIDTESGRIYLPPTSIPGGHGLRSLALQAMAHRVLGHGRPASYAEFLEQRLQINYFASACLMPESSAVAFLQQAKRDRNLAIEDFRDAYGVTHEAAAHRFSNLATEHLNLRVHHYRIDTAGGLTRGYENDGLPYPSDQTGAIEGQLVCRKWAGRTAFERTNRTSEYYQFTDTPVGTYWSTVQTGEADQGAFSIACGVAFDDAKWFRGRDTHTRAASHCPDPDCCRTPSEEQRDRWDGKVWPSAKMHAHMLSPLPTGTFPGVDDIEMYEFLSRHASAESGAPTE